MADFSEHKADKKVEEEFDEIPQQGCGILGRYPVLSVLIFAGKSSGAFPLSVFCGTEIGTVISFLPLVLLLICVCRLTYSIRTLRLKRNRLEAIHVSFFISNNLSFSPLRGLFSAVVGICIGIGLSFWDDDGDTKPKVIKWIGLIGDLFIRALKCVVLPLVFINVVISVMEMMEIGRAGSIGWKTIGLYFLTTVIASILGIISIVSFKGLFEAGDFADPSPATVKLGCNDSDMFLTEMEDGSVMCSADMEESSTFLIEDIEGTFVKSSGGVRSDISLSDTIYDGVFTKLVTDNIVSSFDTANFAAVVFFSIAFGVALSKILLDREGGSKDSFVLGFFKELDSVFITIINWIIACTP